MTRRWGRDNEKRKINFVIIANYEIIIIIILYYAIISNEIIILEGFHNLLMILLVYLSFCKYPNIYEREYTSRNCIFILICLNKIKFAVSATIFINFSSAVPIKPQLICCSLDVICMVIQLQF